MNQPRVSILIPNFNNGRASSIDGRRDLIGDLLSSLHETLADDPTPLEIIALDDGSTDDSLATLRDWAGRTWRGGQPFLTLIEREHCGVLSVTANELVRRSRGDILVRLDGDVTCDTPRWAQVLVRLFDEGPDDVGVIGPMQLQPNGRVHALGDWLLHPKGYHHIGEGLAPEALVRPIECDHVMGCFYCCRRAVHDQLGGFDETFLRGQTIDFGVRARLEGWRCVATPQVRCHHWHKQRLCRSTNADSGSGIYASLKHFREKWGFCRVAPDLDAVAQRYAGTPLLWNRSVFGGRPPMHVLDQPGGDTATAQDSSWARYTSDPRVRQLVDAQVQIVAQIAGEAGPNQRLGGVWIGCGDGLGPHLLARRDLRVRAVGFSQAAVELAQQMCQTQEYPGKRPSFQLANAHDDTALATASADWVVITGVLERHPNPMALVRHAAGLLRVGGKLGVTTAGHPARLISVAEAMQPFLPQELANLLRAGGELAVDAVPREVNGPFALLATREAAGLAAAA